MIFVSLQLSIISGIDATSWETCRISHSCICGPGERCVAWMALVLSMQWWWPYVSLSWGRGEAVWPDCRALEAICHSCCYIYSGQIHCGISLLPYWEELPHNCVWAPELINMWILFWASGGRTRKKEQQTQNNDCLFTNSRTQNPRGEESSKFSHPCI